MSQTRGLLAIGTATTMRHFLNLTNGLQAIADYQLTDYRFVRIQSTWCEQKRWNDILWTLSDDFLMALALGEMCVVYDYGANKQVPRAMWQGLEWVKFVLRRRWFNEDYVPFGRAAPGLFYFQQQYRRLSPRVKAKLDYYKKYAGHAIHVYAITASTDRDGQDFSVFLKTRKTQKKQAHLFSENP